MESRFVKAKILEKNILITDTAAREAVEGYEYAETIENSESGIYNKLRNIILQKNKKAIETNSLNKYDNKKIIKKIEEILGE